MSAKVLYIGLDAGGSKTELLARSDPGNGNDLSLSGPAANLQRAGPAQTAQTLAALIREALTTHPAPGRASVCAGVAGAGSHADQHALAEAVRRRLAGTDCAVQVVHDAAIALEAAFEGESGIVVIAGTGSVVFARSADGNLHRAGGWGYLLGDEGSGHALGIAGLRAVAAALDGGPPTRLRRLLAERQGLRTREALIRRVYREGWPVQEAAPLVIEAAAEGDAVARRLLEEQTQRLARQAAWLRARCPSIQPQAALLGGLVGEAPYRRTLEAALHEALPGWSIRQPVHRPVVGALRLAMAAG